MDIETFRGGIIVSCQARPGSPVYGPHHMAAMAKAAELGGARGIRANGAEDIEAIKRSTSLPVIGISKVGRDRNPVYITPRFEDARSIAAAGADLIATDGTLRPRPDGGSLPELIARIHGELGLQVMADVDSVEAGRAAAEAGADIVATTLSGYTSGVTPELPDIALVAALVRETGVPVIAEGRYWTPEQLLLAFAAGAHAVVVGTAITNPMAITQRFVRSLRSLEPGRQG